MITLTANNSTDVTFDTYSMEECPFRVGDTVICILAAEAPAYTIEEGEQMVITEIFPGSAASHKNLATLRRDPEFRRSSGECFFAGHFKLAPNGTTKVLGVPK